MRRDSQRHAAVVAELDLPLDVAQGVDIVVGATEATVSNAADVAWALNKCGAEASEPLVVAALGHRRERRLVDAPLVRSMSWPWRGGGHRHGRAGAEVDGERDGGDHEEDRWTRRRRSRTRWTRICRVCRRWPEASSLLFFFRFFLFVTRNVIVMFFIFRFFLFFRDYFRA